MSHFAALLGDSRRPILSRPGDIQPEKFLTAPPFGLAGLRLATTIAERERTSPRPPRAETREIVELKQLKEAQPELAAAIDMQIALVDMQRRVQGRVPLPWIQVDPEWMRVQQLAGRPLVRFRNIPLEWSDFRLTFRQTSDILQRFDALERPDYDKIVALGSGERPRSAGTCAKQPRASRPAATRHRAPSDAPASLDQVLVLALRPVSRALPER
jgi:hypothetical protein